MDQNGVCRDVDVIAECADIFPDSDLIKTSNNNAEVITVEYYIFKAHSLFEITIMQKLTKL